MRLIEAEGRTLLSTLHMTPRLRPRGAAALLCNPFGEEAVRAHRAYRVLARRLDDAGYPTLRFDYAGTGDSSGDANDFGLSTWIEDIAVAADTLRRDSGQARIVLIGLRLGGTLAMLGAQRRLIRPAHVLMWDPVVDGAQYLRDLGHAHDAYMRAELGSAYRVAAPDAPAMEALGMPLTPALRAELETIDLCRDPPAAVTTTVLCTQRGPEMARLKDAWADRGRAHWIDLDASAAWNSDAALNDAIVPMNEILALIARIESCHP
jgi:pimeloyl-ACP methyl ester carboxylesterase